MDCKILLVLFVMVSWQVYDASGYNLTIHPRHARITEDLNTLTVSCAAGVVLAGCQFIWRDEKHSGPIMDLSQGAQSSVNPDHLDKYITDYSYSGRGLVAGDCGITMHLSGVKVWMVGCRVHAAQGGWRYAWADLFAHSAGLLPNTATTREAVVFPGGEAKLILKAMVPLDLCHFYLPGIPGQINFDKGPHSVQSAGRLRYHGAGVQIGECGVAVYNISEANNGPARCYVRSTRTTSDDYKYFPFIVARAPSPPSLHGYYEGDIIKATCSVASSRPAPNITWLLGDEVIRQDSVDDSPADLRDEWLWPWTKTSTTQMLSRKLHAGDDGKNLRCIVTHLALSRPLEASKRITYIQSTISDNYYGSAKMDDSPFVRLRVVDEEFMSADTPTSSIDDNHSLAMNNATSQYDTRDLRMREARASATTAELNLEAARIRARTEEALWTEAKLLVEAAQSRARAEDARARAAELMVKAALSRARAAEEARMLTAARDDNKWGEETRVEETRDMGDYNLEDQDHYDVPSRSFRYGQRDLN